MITGKRNREDELLTSAYLTETHKLLTEGRRTLSHRLKSQYAYNEACIEAFREDIVLFRGLSHPNMLGYTDVETEEEGMRSIVLESVNGVTLETYLFDNPSFVTDVAEMERIVNEVMDVLAYLHKQGVCHLDLHPRNILLTKSGHTVKLTNPLFAYAHLIHPLSLAPNGYVAPEWFSQMVVADPIRSDIYSLGSLIEYLYDMGTLPYRYRRVVKLAKSPDPSLRPAGIKAFRRIVSQARRVQLVAKGILCIVMTLLVCMGIFALTTSSPEDEIHFIPSTSDNTYIYDSISGQEYYLNDSAMAVRNAMMERQQEEMMKVYDRKVSDIFKKTFRKKAEPIIYEIYTESHIEDQSSALPYATRRGMKQLLEIQEELSEQYGIDPATSASVAASIIDELTRQCMKDLQRMK